MSGSALRAIRHLAAALVVCTAMRAGVDALLQWALAAVMPGVTVYGGATRALQQSIAVVASALLWLAAPAWASWLEGLSSELSVSKRAAYAMIGTAAVVVPIVWLLATWVVAAVRLTATGSWTTEGRIFLESSSYSLAVTGTAPWLMAGAVLLALARHTGDD